MEKLNDDVVFEQSEEQKSLQRSAAKVIRASLGYTMLSLVIIIVGVFVRSVLVALESKTVGESILFGAIVLSMAVFVGGCGRSVYKFIKGS